MTSLQILAALALLSATANAPVFSGTLQGQARRTAGVPAAIALQRSRYWHFSDIAAPIGGVGERVTTRRVLAAALDCAVKRHGQFSLVEVKLTRGATSHTLARFVCGFKSVRERTAKT
jgi:hypothetical protein